MTKEKFPEIIAVCKGGGGHAQQSLYTDAVRESVEMLLRERIPDHASFGSTVYLKEQLLEILPLVSVAFSSENKREVTFYMVNRHRKNSFKFFFEMFSRWALPGKKLDVTMLFAADFKIEGLDGELFTLCEIKGEVPNVEDIAILCANLPLIEVEARLGLESAYYARRILEVKGLTNDSKTSSIQEHMAQLVKKAPTIFDRDLFTEMQHVLVVCSDEFKSQHTTRHLCRLIGTGYYFRRGLIEAVRDNPNSRHLRLRVFPATIKKEVDGRQSVQNVLSLVIGLNFLKSKEVFEEQHIMQSIQSYIPAAKPVKGSFFLCKRNGEQVAFVYLEIEYGDKRPFTCKERRLLKKELEVDLKDRIGQLMHPVFMPRNEEEIMRNVLALSHQVKYLRDIPQVFITFDEQIDDQLMFLVIMVRVLSPGEPSIQELFIKAGSTLEYNHDRSKMIGYVRNKYAKEATIFRLKLKSRPFIRQDNSIDLFKARQEVVEELTRIKGEVRDFNGGMISKQHEMLCSVKKLLLEDNVKYNELLLENFFYSLTPVVMRTVSEPAAVKALYCMHLESAREGFLNEGESFSRIETEGSYVYAIVKSRDNALEQALSQELEKVPRQSASLVTAHAQIYGVPCIGYIFRTEIEEDRTLFIETLNHVIEGWSRGGEMALGSPA